MNEARPAERVWEARVQEKKDMNMTVGEALKERNIMWDEVMLGQQRIEISGRTD